MIQRSRTDRTHPSPASPAESPCFSSARSTPSLHGLRVREANGGSRALYYARSMLTLAARVRSPIATAWSLAGRRRPTRVALRNGVTLRCRDAMDLWIVKETCLDRDYEPEGHRVRPGDRVLDLGAGIGDFAVTAAILGGARCVVACEPDPSSFALLCENVRANGAHGVVPLALAASPDGGPLELASDAHPVLGATRPATGRGTPVASATLGDLVARLPGGCDFMKIDVEGGEYALLLEGCDAATLAAIDRISVEIHPAPPGRVHELVAKLEASGFAVRVAPSPVHRGQGLLFAQRRVSA